MPRPLFLFGIAWLSVAATPTDGPRATLVRAAFATGQKAQAITLVDGALANLSAILVRSPTDHDALLQQGIGLGYRGQLTRSMGDAKRARDILAGLAARYPNDAESQIALGGWHATVIGDVGSFVGSTVLGASRKTGLAALDRAVRLGGNHAFYPAYAGLMRLRLDGGDKAALPLLDRAIAAQTTTELDRITQAAAKRVAPLLRSGDTRGASALAKQLLPFGRIT